MPRDLSTELAEVRQMADALVAAEARVMKLEAAIRRHYGDTGRLHGVGSYNECDEKLYDCLPDAQGGADATT